MTWSNFIGCLILLGWGFGCGYRWNRVVHRKVIADILKLLHESRQREQQDLQIIQAMTHQLDDSSKAMEVIMGPDDPEAIDWSVLGV